MADGYETWRQEIDNPIKPGERGDDGSASHYGFWRLIAARIKPDYPTALWPDGEGRVIVRIGKREFFLDSPDGNDFIASSWPWCAAVPKAAYDAAVESGRWADGKPSRKMDDEEKLGIDLSPGPNAAPIEEAIADQIATIADKLTKTKEPTSRAEASALAGDLDRMRLLLKRADEQRTKEKEPFLVGGRTVDEKWKTIAEPGGDAYRAGTERQKAYLRKEQARLDVEAREKERQARAVAAAEAARLAEEENARRAGEAKEAGEPAPEPVKAEDIAVAVAPVQAERAKAGTSYGRATGLRKVKVAIIEDRDKLIAHIKDDFDFTTYLQGRADAALRAKVVLPGVKIDEVLK